MSKLKTIPTLKFLRRRTLRNCCAVIGCLIFASLLVMSDVAVGQVDEVCSKQKNDTIELYYCLQKNGKETEAKNVLYKLDVTTNPTVSFVRAFRNFRGVGKEDKSCETVLNFERAHQSGMGASQPFLDWIYRGNWRAIAASEGNAFALYELGKWYLDAALLKHGVQDNAAHMAGREKALSVAFGYLKAASSLGEKRAYSSLSIARGHLRELKVNIAKIPEPTFARVICPVR